MIWTFDDSRLTFHQVQHMHATPVFVKDGAIEPMSSRFDELARVQASSFFFPPGADGNWTNAIDEVFLYPIAVTVPLNVGQTVFEMNGTRLAIQSRPAPIPELESEDVRRGADFQNHAVAAGAVNRSSWNQEVIMFACGPLVHVFLGIKRNASLLCSTKFRSHLFPVYVWL